MRIRTAVVVVAAAGLLAGCADVVDGTGSSALGGGRTGTAPAPDFPSASGPGAPSASGPSASEPARPTPSGSASVAAPTSCPHVVYPAARIAFDCITGGLTATSSNGFWPLSEYKTVEATTHWVLEEGAGHWGPSDGKSLAAISVAVRDQMVHDGGYGDGPKITTDRNADTTVDGAKAHVLQTTFTLDPAWAAKRGTKVKQEKLWVVAIEVGSDDVSLWYTSVPDLAKSLWSRVPAVIGAIKVS